ncbi:MAG: TIM-barrel domain-containing protein [Oliverpabstia sp.]
MSLEKYKVDVRPKANEKAIIQGKCYRITILTPALARFEYSARGEFEDRATQKVYNRDFPVPEYRVREDGELHIFTDYLEIHYNKKEFSKSGLSVRTAGGPGGDSIWHYGEETRDFRGTARTLDQVNGKCELEHGIQSIMTGAVMDDTGSMVIREDGFVEPRSKENIDFYFFGYGRRYLDCLKDFYYLCGNTPLLPRYTLGNWWSRYYEYDESEYKELITRFEKEEIPFSIAVVDMDWHLVDIDPMYGGGWTGYTWNRELFPDPPEFMEWLHEHNLKITLNVHPADGIRAYEEAYPRIAEKMGIDPDTGETVTFDMTNEKFIETYFEDLHHPLEEEGVDFWWVDWQQGSVSKVEGLDPLWMLNHYHYLDSKWKGKRPLTFSRYAGPGSHRYPIGFSGDTIITWESLDFQPYFTANASNIGYGWWSHDIGGHMMGVRDDELTTRWVQFGVFSPINRLHSSNSAFSGKEPWKYGVRAEKVMKKFLRLRNEMVPYLYTMNRYASRDGVPLILPLYYKEPMSIDSYMMKNNYYFGTELLVSPITEPMDREAGMAKAKTHIPEGIWYDFFTGHRYVGGKTINLWRALEDMPVLAKAGAIVPMKDAEIYDNSVENPERMKICIYPGADGCFTLWEDQGDTPEDLDENWVSTKLVWQWNGEEQKFIIGAATGNTDVIPGKRDWKLIFYHVNPVNVNVTVEGNRIAADTAYENEKLIVKIKNIPVEKEVQVSFEGGLSECENPLEKETFAILERAQIAYHLKSNLMRAIKSQGKYSAPSILAADGPRALEGALIEVISD